jgi:dTDP-4-amino-4,6-dideoxygalactose transaminase
MENSKIWLSAPHMGTEELKNVQEAFATNWVAPAGPFINQFEQDLSEYNNVKHTAVVQSGTAAIHLALRLLDVGQDDVVLCQSFTFIGSSNPITYQQAQPVFIDSEAETWNMCPDAMETAIKHFLKQGKKPKAILVVHLYGMPAKIREISEISERYGIPIIEDAAEALGSSIDGQACGSFGAFGILSFNGNKIITTSGGGALQSNDESAIAKARFLATQAKDAAPHYEHSTVGYNYRMSNIAAAIGVGQLQVLNERVAARRANYTFYEELFAQVDGVHFLEEPQGFFSNRWLSCILMEQSENQKLSPEKFRLHLEQDNIESRPLWKPMHLQPLYKDAPYFGGQVAEKLFQKGICLPSGSNLTNHDKERIQKSIQTFLNL